jgi:hypothetical protein
VREVDHVEVVSPYASKWIVVHLHLVARNSGQLLRMTCSLDLPRGDLVGFQLRFSQEFQGQNHVREGVTNEVKKPRSAIDKRLRRPHVWPYQRPRPHGVHRVALQKKARAGEPSPPARHLARPVVERVSESAPESVDSLGHLGSAQWIFSFLSSMETNSSILRARVSAFLAVCIRQRMAYRFALSRVSKKALASAFVFNAA